MDCATFNELSEREGWEQLCDPALAFSRADFAEFLALWTEKAAGRAVPTRGDMTARALKPFLPKVALKERVECDPSRYRWRLVGTYVAQILGERTGQFLEEGASPRAVARWTASCDLVLKTARPLRFVGRVLAKDFLTSELLFTPLAGDDGVPRFVMGFGHYNAEPDWRALLRGAAVAA
ncbi:MAG TPA: PAS domain-containing protein [Rhizomicrobium sp.]|jgi:hypothetical protein